ncbi:MAG: rRNA maturation RNase YbeY [Thiohalomonadales bacterium]
MAQPVSQSTPTAPPKNVVVDLQLACTESTQFDLQLPMFQQFEAWIVAVLAFVDWRKNTEVTIRVVDGDEMTMLNETYRKKIGTTNVLSFPFSPYPEGKVENVLVGDIVICAMVICQESEQQNKTCIDHWAHMVVHGMLHLLGYDHLSNQQAEEMESLEIKIMKYLKISNPYGETKNL